MTGQSQLPPQVLERLEALQIPVKPWSPHELLAVMQGHRTLGQLAGVSKATQLEMAAMGLNLLNNNLKHKAREVFLGLEALDPYDAYVQVVLGTINLDDEDWDEADRRFTRALQLNPESVPALYHRGTLRLQRGKTRAAIDDLSLAVAKDPHGKLELTSRAKLTLAAAKKKASVAPRVR